MRRHILFPQPKDWLLAQLSRLRRCKRRTFYTRVTRAWCPPYGTTAKGDRSSLSLWKLRKYREHLRFSLLIFLWILACVSARSSDVSLQCFNDVGVELPNDCAVPCLGNAKRKGPLRSTCSTGGQQCCTMIREWLFNFDAQLDGAQVNTGPVPILEILRTI